MRIVIWNCNMGFHNKYEALLALKPDVAIIPECANIDLIEKSAPEFRPTSAIWIGDNPRKGLAVFTFGQFSATLADCYEDQLCPFIAPIMIDGPISFNLLAVWACHHRKNWYVNRRGPLNRAITAYRSFIESKPCIVAGDFNDNVLWDKPKRPNNHSINVGALNSLGLRSAYHVSRVVDQGKELDPTLYWRDRKLNGPKYHIDYCFIPDAWTNSILNVTVGHFDDWVGRGLSDHVPLVVDIDEVKIEGFERKYISLVDNASHVADV
jgi:exodeoxyribonuclease-3